MQFTSAVDLATFAVSFCVRVKQFFFFHISYQSLLRIYFLAFNLIAKGDWLAAFNLYSAKVLKELPYVGFHLRPKLREFLAALNALPATDSFWNAILETVLKLLAEIIITNLGIQRGKKRNQGIIGDG